MRIGTRASALALAQARWVASEVDHSELVEISTSGDRGERIGDKSRWVSELEQALLDGRIDLAVHSAKDVPGELAPGTEISAVPAREDPRDVIVGVRSLDELPSGARVGTSSIRRAAQLHALRDDLVIVELRGNVDTRLRKLAEGEADAIVVAAAGLHRLGLADKAGGVLEQLVPAPGQGALIVQARKGDKMAAVAARNLDHGGAGMYVREERILARALGASCNTPLGAYATTPERHASLTMSRGSYVQMRAWVGLRDGSEWIADELIGYAGHVGEDLAERMIALGARDLLARAEAEATA